MHPGMVGALLRFWQECWGAGRKLSDVRLVSVCAVSELVLPCLCPWKDQGTEGNRGLVHNGLYSYGFLRLMHLGTRGSGNRPAFSEYCSWIEWENAYTAVTLLYTFFCAEHTNRTNFLKDMHLMWLCLNFNVICSVVCRASSLLMGLDTLCMPTANQTTPKLEAKGNKIPLSLY